MNVASKKTIYNIHSMTVNVAVVKYSGIYNFFIFNLTEKLFSNLYPKKSTQKPTTIRYAVNLMQNRYFKEKTTIKSNSFMHYCKNKP